MTTLPCLALLAALLACSCAAFAAAPAASSSERWSEDKANAWYAKQPWLVGCNYIPSTAINQLEMWQADTFDPATVDRELGWAEGLGFNSIRVFLHDLAYTEDPEGFFKRTDQFLTIADKHRIRVMFVIFDGCWDPFPKPGRQRAPKPHTHNSGWVQSPSQDVLKDPAKHDALKPYVQAVISRYKADPRVVLWDLYNEPDNPNVSAYGKAEIKDKADMALALLTKTFAWAREVNPSQPLSAGVWHGNWTTPDAMPPVGRFCALHSDVITFHTYTPLQTTTDRVSELKQFNRPLICTEYMARPAGSTFETILPYFKQQHVAAYNWGFVDGKSQTIYPWDSWTKQYTAEPPVWFHDILHTDGTPYAPTEVALIKRMAAQE